MSADELDDERAPWDPVPMSRDELFELAVERGVMRWLDANSDRIVTAVAAAVSSRVVEQPSESENEEPVGVSDHPWWLDEIGEDRAAPLVGDGQRVARQIVQALRHVDAVDGLTRNELRALIESVPGNRPSKSTWHAGFALARRVGAIEPAEPGNPSRFVLGFGYRNGAR